MCKTQRQVSKAEDEKGEITMLESYDDLLRVEEACEILHIGRNSLYELLRNGELKGFRQGRIWKVPKQSVELYIKERAGLN